MPEYAPEITPDLAPDSEKNPNPTIGFIGAGLFGKGLAWALAAQGSPVVAVHSRSLNSAQALAGRIPGCRVFATPQELADAVDLVFITTPDSVISQVAGAVNWRPGQGVAHCCGGASPSLLEPASNQGAAIGAFHPFQTFSGLADGEDPGERLSGVTFAVSGSGWLEGFLWDLARGLGGQPVAIPDDWRPLYHAAAVMACGHLAALMQASVDVWQTMGFTQDQALEALYPLCRTTLDAVARSGAEASITGPVVRGDIDTVRAHLEALFKNLPDLAPLYAALTAASLPLAANRGVGPGEVTAMQELIDYYSGTE